MSARAPGLRRARSGAVTLVLALALTACTSSAQFLYEEYTNAGLQAFGAGQYGRAELYLNRAAQKAEDLGPRELGRSLNNLGELARQHSRVAGARGDASRASRDLTEAERYFQRAVVVKETGLSRDDPDVATSLNNLAQVYLAQHRDADAVPVLERSLQIQEKALDPDHPGLRRTLTLLSEAYKEVGRPNDAFAMEVRIKLLRPE